MAKGKKKAGATDKGPSKKTIDKEKQKVIKDNTFGLKNKNKSKKVQKHIKGVHQKVEGDPRKKKQELDEREKKKLVKLAQKARERELKTLFNAVETPKTQEEIDQENKDYDEKDILEEVEAEMKSEEEMTMEEVIDKQRAQIINGTPVTWESFTQWKKFKDEQRTKEEERLSKLREEAFKAKKGGISGRFLFEMDKSLFVDDEEAADNEAYVRDEDVDEDLFLDDDDEELEEEEEKAYDPDTYKLEITPKGLLIQYCQKNKHEQPSFKNDSAGDGFLISATLPHLKKKFETKTIYKVKKHSENNAALQALIYLHDQDGTEFKYD